MELEIPQIPSILKPTLSTIMVQRVLQWEWQRRGSLPTNIRGPWQRNVIYKYVCVCVSKHFHSYKERREEEEEKVKHEEESPNCPFLYIFLKTNTSIFGAWSLLLVHVRFTPSQRPKGFFNVFLVIRPWKCDHEV